MVTKKKSSPKKRQPRPMAPLSAPLPAAPAQPQASSADWRWMIGLVLLAFAVTKLWDMRDWKTGGISFLGFGSPPLISAQFQGAYADRGVEPGQVQGCRALAEDKDGNAYYYYLPYFLKKLSPEGKLLASYKADKKDKFEYLWALAPAPDGSLWACEHGGNRLLHFSADLKLIGSLKTPQAGVNDLAIDSQGRFLVTMTSGPLLVLDATGKILARVGDEVEHPINNAAKLALDEKDGIFVLVQGDASAQGPQDPHILSYDKDGKFLAGWTVSGSPLSEFTCLAYDPQGYLVVSNNGQVSTRGLQLYNKQGKLKALIQAASNGGGLMSVPALAIGAGGDWAVDATPQGRGCDHLRLPSLGKK